VKIFYANCAHEIFTVPEVYKEQQDIKEHVQ